MDQMRLDFTVPEKYSPRNHHEPVCQLQGGRKGQTICCKGDCNRVNITQDTRTLLVRAAVQGDPSGLVPGNFAKVTLNFEPNRKAITIPTQAIIPQARGKKVYVFNNGKANFVDVTTGVRDSSTIQITSGLKPGDTILVTGLLAIKPGGPVSLGKVINQGSQPAPEMKRRALAIPVNRHNNSLTKPFRGRRNKI